MYTVFEIIYLAFLLKLITGNATDEATGHHVLLSEQLNRKRQYSDKVYLKPEIGGHQRTKWRM